MKNICFFGIAGLLALFAASAAVADMDYRCLNSCVGSGKPSNACMTQCSYGASAHVSHGPSLYTPVRSPHDQFTPPVPSDQVLLHTGKSRTPAGKDYTCVSQCRQDSHPYQFCEEQCANVATPAADINSAPGATTTLNPSSLITTRPSLTGR